MAERNADVPVPDGGSIAAADGQLPRRTRSNASDSKSPPSRSHSIHLAHMAASPNHRQSFGESLRGLPPSPRASRQPSFSHLAIQELINNPPAQKPDPRFAGRDWRSVKVEELVQPADLHFVDADTSVEAATNLLIDSGAPVLLIRETTTSDSAIGTFDYTDLNAYLLLVVGLAQPDEAHIDTFIELARKAREGSKIPLKDIRDIGNKSDPIFPLPHTATLSQAVEAFGGGVHRVVVVQEGTEKVVGILSQSRLIKFLWENARAFSALEHLYHQNLRDLRIGSVQVIAIK